MKEGTGLDDYHAWLNAIDGRQVHVTITRHEWGMTRHISDSPEVPGMDLDELTDAVSRRMAKRAHAEGME